MPDDMSNLILKQIAEIEQKDEAQVLAELAGELIGEMVYTVKTYDRRAKKEIERSRLSWAGTKEVARSRGNIVLSEPVVTDLDNTIRIMVRATDLTRNFTVFGGCQQPRKMKLTTAEREVTLRLLRFWAYYGNVYPKASTVAAEPGCSKATFWRTIALLERLGLMRRINRYVIRPHAQISNLYRHKG
ncbi:unnamed protein product, partial [marine sediment metagenome]